MRRVFAIVVLASSVAGCAALGSINNPVNLNSLAAVESSYGVALSAAAGYRRLPLCTISAPLSVYNVCAKRAVVAQLQTADRKVQIALAAARSYAAGNPKLSASNVITTARTAVSTFQAILSVNGVK